MISRWPELTGRSSNQRMIVPLDAVKVSGGFIMSAGGENMYSLDELFRGSTHKASVFTPEAVKWLEDAVFMKPSKNGEVPYVKCIIRNRDIRLTPEEAVRQLYVYDLIHTEGYSPDNIKLEHPVHFGREVKRADIVIFEKKHPDSEYIIIEVKKPKLLEGKAQLKSYCNATGALIGVWTNGEIIECYHRKDPNYFEKVKHLPKAHQTLKDVIGERWTLADLERENKLKDGKITLKDIITDIEDEVLANAGVDVFEEVFKLIFTKLYDEMKSVRNESRLLEFGNYGDTDEDLKENIQALFDLAKDEWQGVFTADDKITLNPSHLAVCVSSLQNVKLFNSNLEVVDDAFEYLMTKSQKGEKGQFFTPRYVIDMCVKMLNPQENEYMIDTAAGSCGFPVHTMFYVWGLIYDRLGLPRRNMFTAEKKPEECTDYVRKKVFAIDFDAKTVRVARTLNLIAGDGQTNVMHLNTLDYMNWEEVIKSEDWIDIYNEGWKGLRGLRAVKKSNLGFMFDIVMANPPFAGDVKEGKIISQYELAKDKKGKYVSKIGRDILFIERNLQFLKPGGRMAIILPQGRFNNSSDKYIRDFISERCRILAVIGLHENVFKPHTGTKTSVLLVQKWDDELCPRREDYPIFFATMRKPGKDNSGEKIYRKNEDGTPKLDGHNHPIVEHDLYNHEGLTEDGIAEAFREFAAREGLSFFVGARFDEARYESLRGGLEIIEVMLSELENNSTLGAEYYGGKYTDASRVIKSCGKVETLSDISEQITDGDHGVMRYYDEGVMFILSEFVKEGYIDTSTIKYIPRKRHEYLSKSALKPGDVVLTKTGYFGRSAVVPDNMPEANICADVAKVRLKKGYSPYFLSAFLNCKYGYYQLQRRGVKTTRPAVKLVELQDVQIPKMSDEFDSLIEEVTRRGIDARAESVRLYTQADSLLTSQLGQVPHDSTSTTTRSLSEVFSAGRLDAEYFMPKYDDILGIINSYKDGCATISSLFRQVTTKCSRTEPSYRYVEISDINIGTGSASYNDIQTPDLPDNAKIMTLKDDVLVSKVRPNRGAVAILDEDGLLVSGAFTVLREAADYKREVLQVLLRSELYRELLLRFNVGTSYPVIKDEDVMNLPIPLIDSDTQSLIADHVRQSFFLRRRSDSLISSAVHAVELAIESGEHSAMDYLNSTL